MKKSLTHFLRVFCLVAIIGLLFAPVGSNAAVKRALIEVHTGTWCGYCPDGAVRLQEIVNKYPDRAIGVAWHNNDVMALPEQPTISSFYNIGGYPNGTIDRRPWGGAYMKGRGDWMSCAEQTLAMTAECDVSSYYVLNETSRSMDVYVAAKFETSLSGDIRFNAYILEDGIIEPQNGATQDYSHKNVLRKLLGGIWGSDGVIPSDVKPGDKFTVKYSLNIPASWNIKNVRAIGIVQRYGASAADRVILNCAHSVPGVPTFEAAMSAPTAKVISQGEKFSKEITIKNLTDKKISVSLTTAMSGRTPTGWTCEVKTSSKIGKIRNDDILATEIAIEPAQTTRVFFEIVPNNNPGIGDAQVTITQLNNPDAAKAAYTITAISKELESVELLISGETAYNVNPAVKASGRTQYAPLMIDDFIAIDAELPNIKYMILSGGNKGMIAPGGADFIKRKMDAGVGVLINGGVTLIYMLQNSPSHALLQELGISWTMGTDIQVEKFSLQGVSGDPISNGMVFNDCNLVPGGYYLQPLNITKPSTTNKILTLNAQTVATRTEGKDARAVVIQFNPYILATDAQRKNLIDACLDWIESKPAKGPIVATNVSSIAFNKVGIGQQGSKTFKVTNSGDQPLVISKVEVEYNYSHIFKIEGKATNITVPVGGEQEFTVTFEPKDKIPYSSYLTVKSNASNEPTKTVTLTGIGEDLGTVKDGIASNGTLTLSVSPNPISEKSIINYSIAGIGAKTIELNIINQAGAKIAEIFNGTQNAGEYSASFNPSMLSSGTYYLLLKADNTIVNLPVIVVK